MYGKSATLRGCFFTRYLPIDNVRCSTTNRRLSDRKVFFTKM